MSDISDTIRFVTQHSPGAEIVESKDGFEIRNKTTHELIGEKMPTNIKAWRSAAFEIARRREMPTVGGSSKRSVRSILGEPIVISDKMSRKEMTRRLLSQQAILEAVVAHLEATGVNLEHTTKGLAFQKNTAL